MKPTKKLYEITIGAIEDGVEFNHFDSKTVVATDALSASKKIRLRKTKTQETFIESIRKISNIDRL